uniref:RING-type E3 ubiquitin transferase n=1 Tax=Acrobeloides nanus TaxID=290746 RepID=A0A914C4K8_9BILA
MAPVAQSLTWSEILCCQICNKIFSSDRLPINLICGHAACVVCLKSPPESCPHDHVAIQRDVLQFPPNSALLSILGVNNVQEDSAFGNTPGSVVQSVEEHLLHLASFLHLADSEKGGTVFSDVISRTVQKKIISLLCTQIFHENGREQAMRTIRSLVERLLTELSLGLQSNAHISSYLWSAVRSRGCQFLGPAMQEDVLRLILLTLSKGELIARKTLVMYIVQTLSEDYPHVSKTCVGHVVQLLYRASCFNVIKRDGESSLMQLKEEFRNYDALRREHDTQIVQIALEAGLRISPDQWSSLLYGDPHHRSHMQSLVDKLHSPQLISNALQEFKAIIYKNDDVDKFSNIMPHLETIAKTDYEQDHVDWSFFNTILFSLRTIMDTYVQFSRSRNSSSETRSTKKPEISNGCAPLGLRLYKTRICRDVSVGRTCPRGDRCTYAHSASDDVSVGRTCPRGDRCTYAHSASELRNPSGATNMDFQQYGSSDLQTSLSGFHKEAHESRMGSSGAGMVNNTSPVRFNSIHPGYVANVQQVFPTFDNTQMLIQDPQNVEQTRLIVDNNPMSMMPMVIGQAQLNPAQPSNNIGAAQMNQPLYMDPTLVSHVVMPSRQMTLLPTGFNPPETNLTVQPAIVQPIDPGMQSFQVFPVQVKPAPATTPPLPLATPIWNYHVDMTIPPPTALPFHPHSLATATLNEMVMSTNVTQDGLRRDSSEMPEEENLLLRRSEIINRLKEIDDTNDTVDDDLESHVSFTVANSVLYDDKDTRECRTSGIELPPLSLPDAPLSTSLGYTVAPSINLPMLGPTTTTVRTACPTTLLQSGSPRPATVQADCSVMNVMDVIHQPLVTPSIQQKMFSLHANYEMMDPSHLAEHLPKVIKPLPQTPQVPQDLVATTLDRIVEVRAQINDVEKLGGLASTVEKEQLKLEMEIVDRQISSLDKQTQQSCLLKELRVIDEKIENLNVNS